MPRSIKILKKSGIRENFSIQKITRALVRAGADIELADRIANKVFKTVKSGQSTQYVYDLARRYLRTSHPVVGAKFSLREAIYRLGPAGYDFEKYIMLLFRDHDYNTYLPDILNGRCISHEVDVIAEKGDIRAMIECKLRKSSTININIKDVLSTWARFVDLKEGAAKGRCIKINEAWLVTNSKFSKDALIYGECKKMHMLSWDSPIGKPLPAYIDSKNLYPITILQSIKQYHLRALSRCDILLLKDLVDVSFNKLCRETLLSKKQLSPLIDEANKILSFKHRMPNIAGSI